MILVDQWSRAAGTNPCELGGVKHQKCILPCSGDRKSKIKVLPEVAPFTGSRGEPFLVPFSFWNSRRSWACGSTAPISAPSSWSFLYAPGCFPSSVSSLLLRTFVIVLLILRMIFSQDLLLNYVFKCPLKVTFTGTRDYKLHISFFGVGGDTTIQPRSLTFPLRLWRGAPMLLAQHCQEPKVCGHIWDEI